MTELKFNKNTAGWWFLGIVVLVVMISKLGGETEVEPVPTITPQKEEQLSGEINKKEEQLLEQLKESTDFLKEDKLETSSIDSMVNSNMFYHLSREAIVASEEDSEEVKNAKEELKKALIVSQKNNYPEMRVAYASEMQDILKEIGIKVEVSGDLNEKLTITGPALGSSEAQAKVIKDMRGAMEAIRFKSLVVGEFESPHNVEIKISDILDLNTDPVPLSE